ncbi:acyltransferase family protein [Dokdonella sp.]|uniref:acyltransferase family protein n=1 Tax=Dokdonella sp. TaxID=2291710 RepID=UPI003529AFF2
MTERMPGLDLLRLFAGLALIVCHAGFWLSPLRIPDTFWLMLGHLGVELFLVSTGFLLARRGFAAIHAESVWRNWLRALFRLWPLYAVLLVVNLALIPAGDRLPDWIRYLGFAQNLAWPHPEFFGEAWIVAAAAMIMLIVPVIATALHGRKLMPGLLVIAALLLAAHGLRVLLVWQGDPVFDLGVRKILISRLDLPFYGLLVAWLWIGRYALLMRWRGSLAIAGLALLGLSVWMHLTIPLNASMSARVYLLPVCDLGWALMLPWACSARLHASIAVIAQGLAASAFAGLLTHMTALRVGAAYGMPLSPASTADGILMLSSYVLLAVGLALLVCRLIDRPWLALRDRCLPLAAKHPGPVAER